MSGEEFLSSGSAIERSMICEASVALPHARYESPYTARGTAIHAFLEACSKVGREDALAQVDEEFRDVCAELNLDGLHAQLALAAEVSFAYNYVTDTARELGRGQGRIYGDVTRDEIPCTLDVVGVRDVSPLVRRGLYTEYKSGWTTRRAIKLVSQIDFGALCIARTYGCDLVEGQHINVHEGLAPYVQRRVIEGWEIDAFAAELRDHAMRWRELRDRFDAGVMPREFQTGQWCERCPAREFCPAVAQQIRWALQARDTFDGPMRVQLDALDDAQLGVLWDEIDDAERVLSMLRGRIRGIAASRRIRLGVTPDGLERWLMNVISEGNEKLDGEHVFDVIASMPPETWKSADITSEDVATKATKITATKKDVKAALGEAVKRGKKEATMRAVLEALKEIPGGITRKVNTDVKELRLKPALDVREQLGLPPAPDPAPEDTLRYHDGELSPDDVEALAALEHRLPQTEE